METSGVSAATTGGIAGGIAGGFLLLGAVAFFFMTRGNRNRDPIDYNEGGRSREMVPAMQDPKQQAERRDSELRYPVFPENIDSGRIQGGF